jgi:Protein of unknown function (DUF3037)
MWAMNSYQYNLIKYVHNTASGECVNVGLALLAPEMRLLLVRFNSRYTRIGQFFQGAFDGNHYRNMVRGLTNQFQKLAKELQHQEQFLVAFQDLPNELEGLMTKILPEDATL